MVLEGTVSERHSARSDIWCVPRTARAHLADELRLMVANPHDTRAAAISCRCAWWRLTGAPPYLLSLLVEDEDQRRKISCRALATRARKAYPPRTPIRERIQAKLNPENAQPRQALSVPVGMT